jgi:uncharacterized protein YfiM (DUF2279 family)
VKLNYRIIVVIILLLMSGILNCHDWLGRDKLAHFSSSLFITGYSYSAAGNVFGASEARSRQIGVSIALGMGFGKEASDRYVSRGKWSWEDIVWDAAGIACGLVLINNKIID